MTLTNLQVETVGCLIESKKWLNAPEDKTLREYGWIPDAKSAQVKSLFVDDKARQT